MILIVKNIRGKTKKIKLPELGQFYLQLDNKDIFSLTHYPGEQYNKERLRVVAKTGELSVRPAGSNSVYIIQE